ncbi:DUF2637 domain-containing protein [Streptomyces sp. NPDC054956]
MTRAQQVLVGVVAVGAVAIAGIGFAGSYGAVRALAVKKGFGTFALFFPIGIDAGIVVLLALDLLLAWIRIPFPLLRQAAWMLTAATIAFNGAAAWPDPLGVGMHAVIPLLFVVTVEAARHAIGRIADVTEGKDIDSVRITRWLLSPVPTFKLWRRMKLWELRRYEQALGMEQDRLIYQARLQARYGRSWRRKAPVEALLPLRLAKLGVALTPEAAVAGLAAAGIEIEWRPVHAPSVASNSAHRPVPLTAFTAKEAPPKPVEVTLRVPQLPEEGLEECEDEPGNLRENLHDGAGAQLGESADESTIPEENPQVASAPPGPAQQPREDNRTTTPLTFGNDRRSAYAEHGRRELASAWRQSRAVLPKVTETAFAAQHGSTVAKVRKAAKEFPAPSTTTT